MIENRKAISPVIATVILVAVSITVSVSSTYFMYDIAGSYSKFEKIEVQSGVCQIRDTLESEQGQKKGLEGFEYWNVTLTLKNTGTASTSLISVFVNDVEVTQYNSTTAISGEAVTKMSNPMSILCGTTTHIDIYIDSENYLTLSPGTIINVKIRSSSGMHILKLIELV